MFVDVHAHLTHSQFDPDRSEVIARSNDAGLAAVVVNGLEPNSNRIVLEMSIAHKLIVPALGIYPIDAIARLVQDELSFETKVFDVDEEIDFIESQVQTGAAKAVGECGLDGYWVGEKTFAEQERVFVRLMLIAKKNDVPLIIHTRKCEKRAMELLAAQGLKRVNFHCYGGKTNLALQGASEQGWWFSIPANSRKNGAFTKLLRELPPDKVLTETDCPFMPPIKGTRSEPRDVVGTVEWLAELRGWSTETAKAVVWKNFKDLFSNLTHFID